MSREREQEVVTFMHSEGKQPFTSVDLRHGTLVVWDPDSGRYGRLSGVCSLHVGQDERPEERVARIHEFLHDVPDEVAEAILSL